MLANPTSKRFQLRRAAFALHVQLVETLSVAKLAKAYGIGRTLSAIGRVGAGAADLSPVRELFAEGSIVRLSGWIDDLSSDLPLRSAYTVSSSLENWRRSLDGAGDDSAPLVADALAEQAELWRSLLCGELDAESLLSSGDFVRAAVGFAGRLRRLVLSVLARSSLVLVVLAGVVAGAVVAMQGAGSVSEPEKFAFDMSAAFAALFVFVLAEATIVKKSLARAEAALWSAEIDQRVVRAITRLPEFGREAESRADEEFAFLGFFGGRNAQPVAPAAVGEVALAPASLSPFVATTPQVAAPSAGPIALLRQLTRRRLVVVGLLLIVAVGAGMVVRTFAVSTFYVSSGSMSPTLDAGDHVFVDKLPFVQDSINRGDIIVFRRVPADTANVSDPYVVKRVIGLPGERIKSVSDVIYVNGRPIREPWLPALASACAESAYGIPSQVVPPHHYFVLGDCRGDSDDSRIWGTVPASSVVGKVFLVYWRHSHPWWDWF